MNGGIFSGQSLTSYMAELVLIEAGAGDEEAAKQRLAVLRDVALLDTTELALKVADALLATALPEGADRDALHVGVAAVHGVDFLLTWNCRHLANVMLRDRIEEVCEQVGLRPPKICTPEELMGDEP